MSAALQISVLWSEADARNLRPQPDQAAPGAFASREDRNAPAASMGFYRKHTEQLLRRYLYISMQVGRTPSILGESMPRGRVTGRRIKTFEDALIFVLDVEKCLGRLGALERQILNRIVLQSYTQSEAAMLLGMSIRAMNYKFPRALDCLTEKLLDAGLLTIPH